MLFGSVAQFFPLFLGGNQAIAKKVGPCEARLLWIPKNDEGTTSTPRLPSVCSPNTRITPSHDKVYC